jgi:hypothetical protein
MKRRPFSIIYGPSVQDHILAIDKQEHSFIRDTILDQLGREPNVETRNRKPLKQPAQDGAGWELRFSDQNRYRVFYRFDVLRREVRVLAVGVKEGNRLSAGGKEVKL